MLELDTLRTAWRYDRGDALAWFASGAGVVLLGVEAGVLVGVALSMGTLIWRASRPHIAVLGRIAGSEHFRNIERYPAQTRPEVLVLRIDANLFFGNVEAVQQRIEDELRSHPAARNLVLAMSAVSSIDTSALFALSAQCEPGPARHRPAPGRSQGAGDGPPAPVRPVADTERRGFPQYRHRRQEADLATIGPNPSRLRVLSAQCRH
jgi:MFS superfamily sulfate permease-like transporter